MLEPRALLMNTIFTFMTQRKFIRANSITAPVKTMLPYLHFNPSPWGMCWGLLRVYHQIKPLIGTKLRPKFWSSPVAAPIVASLINNTFSSSTFPLPRKKAEIVPILKSGDSEEPANMRPAQLTFLDSNTHIHHLQSGKRNLHSTESVLLYFRDKLLDNMD